MTEEQKKPTQFDQFNDRSAFTNSDFEKNADTFPQTPPQTPAKKLTFLEKLKNRFR